MKRTLIIITTIAAILATTLTAAAFTAHAAPKISTTHTGGSQRHCGAIMAGPGKQPCIMLHNPPRILVTQPTSKRTARPIIAPPKFSRVIFSGDVQHEIQLSLPTRFTVSLMCDGGVVYYTIVDLGGDVTGLPGMPLEHRTITCDNAPHTFKYDLPLSDNIAIETDRETTITVEVA